MLYFFIYTNILQHPDLSVYPLYCREHEGEIRAVFERSKIMIWSDEDNELSPNEKRSLSSYINQKLESIFSIRLSKASKGGKYEKYEINQLFALI